MRRLLTATGALAVLVFPAVAPAGAAPPERGCRDITDGKGNYTRDSHVDPGLLPVPQDDKVVKDDSGVLRFRASLAAPSCSDTTYTFTVFPLSDTDGTGQPLATVVTTGDNATPSVAIEARIADYPEDFVRMRITTTFQRFVIDTAPDTGTNEVLPPDEGGGRIWN